MRAQAKFLADLESWLMSTIMVRTEREAKKLLTETRARLRAQRRIVEAREARQRERETEDGIA